ncbi:MAG: VWA domain-containing protein, partial [Nanoarchaeota archaeon]
NSDCNDNNAQTSDNCINPGTTQSFCENNNLQCINNGQCGSITSVLTCNGNSVINRTTTPSCVGNNCQSNTNEVIVQQCSYGCSNGACNQPNIICSTDSQCNDNSIRTIDQCVNAGTPQSYCRNTEVNCVADVDCGVTGFIGNNFCTSNDIYKTYQNATCVNPATLESNCVVSQTPRLVSDCNDNNAQTTDMCVEENNDAFCDHEILECTSNSQCGNVTTILFCDGNSLMNQTTTPSCIGNNCQSSINNTLVQVCNYSCSNGACLPQITCDQNSDCGNDTISESYCVDTGVYHNIINYTCLNPGTPNSYCQTNITAEVVENCNEMCFEGSCVDISCFSDSDCKDSNRLTLDSCRNPGTTQSFCENIPIICKNNKDCNDGNSSTQDICKNPGTVDSFCKYKNINTCGNGVVENGEECDDGNVHDGDGCSESCLVESCVEMCQSKPFDFDIQIDRSFSTLMPFGYFGYASPFSAFLITGPPKILVEKIVATKFIYAALKTNPKNKIGITAFSSQSTNIRNLSNNAADLEKGLLSIHVFGTTDYYNSIVAGVDKLESQGRKNTTKIIVFISDGKPNGLNGIAKAIDAANYAKQHNVKIYTIGVDGILHVNAPLLRTMASISGGKYQYAGSLIALEEIYRRLGEETCDVICEAP